VLASGAIAECPYVLVSLRHLLREVFAELISNSRATLRNGEIAPVDDRPSNGILQMVIETRSSPSTE
jgi:hypothetical protein